MRHTLKVALGALAGIAVFAAALMVHAQSTTGTIYGMVTDPSGGDRGLRCQRHEYRDRGGADTDH